MMPCILLVNVLTGLYVCDVCVSSQHLYVPMLVGQS